MNVFHAGDGNIHPILLFDERDAEQVARVLAASDEILTKCIELGGSVTGEHGIGVEKISFMDKLFTRGRPGRDGNGPRRLQSHGPLEPAENAPDGRRLRNGNDRAQPPGPPRRRSNVRARLCEVGWDQPASVPAHPRSGR